MKKIKNSKLTLKTETIRQLDNTELKGAYGGGTRTDNPCPAGPTQTLCVTYVQYTCNPSDQCNPTAQTCFCTTFTQYPC